MSEGSNNEEDYAPLVRRNAEGREINGPVIPEEFSDKYLSGILPVGNYSSVDSSTIIFFFDLFGTLVDGYGRPKDSAIHFITTVRQICRATGKIPLFCIYSENLEEGNELVKTRAVEKRLGFIFNSKSKIFEEILQIKKYDHLVEICSNKFHINLKQVNYPVFFFDNSLDQVKSMYSSARTAFSENPQMYYRGFHILNDSSWNNALTEIMPIISNQIPVSHNMVTARPSQFLTSLSELENKLLHLRPMTPSNYKKGGKKTIKNKKTPAKKSRKHLKKK